MKLEILKQINFRILTENEKEKKTSKQLAPLQ